MAGGRPSEYQPEFCQKATELLQGGATDEEVAAEIGISVRTLYRWQARHPEFCQALKAGKEAPDERAVRSLYQKATGYYFVEQQAIKIKTGPHTEKVEIVEVERYQPPDTTAAIFWLKNRRSDQWRDKQEIAFNALSEFDESELRSLAGAIRALKAGRTGEAASSGDTEETRH